MRGGGSHNAHCRCLLNGFGFSYKSWGRGPGLYRVIIFSKYTCSTATIFANGRVLQRGPFDRRFKNLTCN